MSKKILVVDDEPDIAQTVALALELSGYEVRTSNSGSEALAIIRDYSPDLVIIDMVLPGMSGKDVARWIKGREKYKHIPVILITALAQKNEEDSFKEKEIDYYLIKPFDLDHLEAKVREFLDRALSPDQHRP